MAEREREREREKERLPYPSRIDYRKIAAAASEIAAEARIRLLQRRQGQRHRLAQTHRKRAVRGRHRQRMVA